MHDSPDDLLHLGSLASGSPEDSDSASTDSRLHDLNVVACTGLNLLAEEDRISLNQLAPVEIQGWCLSRIAEYQNRNRLLRESYGATARDAICTNKSYVRALRTAYNDAARINQYLPPEMLMEVFSHVHPAVITRSRVPVLRVCRYWRRLLFNTPQFWANLLSLPTSNAWTAGPYVGCFQAIIARSTPKSLTVTIPRSNGIVVDVLTSHASRPSSFQVGTTWGSVEEVARILEQHMPHLTHLVIRCSQPHTTTPTFKLDFPRYLDIRNLELECTHFYTPVAPYPSLCHLKLRHSTIHPSPTSDSVPSLCAVHNALQFFPNLETLSMTCSLSHDDPNGRSRRGLPELTKTVYLPHLSHLEVADIPAYIPLFLSHLVFPTTTSLVLEPAYRLDASRQPTAVPLFPDINPFPSTTAELSLCLDFTRGPDEDRDGLAWWETHGDGVRPVRVTVVGVASHVPTIARFTRQLTDALAPAPAPGVTSLTFNGAYLYRQKDWELLLHNAPELRRFACGRKWFAKGFAGALRRLRSPGGSEGFLCTCLEELVLGWDLPSSIRDLRQWQEGGESQGRSLRDGGQHGESQSESKCPLATSLSEVCDIFGLCLTERAGQCAPIRKLLLSLHWHHYHDRGVLDLEEWQVAWIEQHLRCTLGHLVEDIAISSKIN